MDLYDQDAPDVVQLGDRRQRARKEYSCDTCPLGGPPSSAIIPVGQEYRRITGTIDGEFFTTRSCTGPCPHASRCPSCQGEGQIRIYSSLTDTCPACGGAGKVREHSGLSDPAHQ